jgi:hypothetical protein
VQMGLQPKNLNQCPVARTPRTPRTVPYFSMEYTRPRSARGLPEICPRSARDLPEMVWALNTRKQWELMFCPSCPSKIPPCVPLFGSTGRREFL